MIIKQLQQVGKTETRGTQVIQDNTVLTLVSVENIIRAAGNENRIILLFRHSLSESGFTSTAISVNVNTIHSTLRSSQFIPPKRKSTINRPLITDVFCHWHVVSIIILTDFSVFNTSNNLIKPRYLAFWRIHPFVDFFLIIKVCTNIFSEILEFVGVICVNQVSLCGGRGCLNLVNILRLHLDSICHHRNLSRGVKSEYCVEMVSL